MRPLARCRILLLLTAPLLTACDDAAPTTGSGALPTVSMTIGSKPYTLEVANTDAARDHGLMERDTLPTDRGMIFVFDDESPRTFWMYHTRFPLDILYVSSAGRIVSIKHMKPYDQTGIPSDGPAKYAIELNLGDADKDGLHPGDTLTIPDAAMASNRPATRATH